MESTQHKKELKIQLFHDNFQNYKSYGIPSKAQLVIADIPFNLGNYAYASNPRWYADGDNKNGESEKAGKQFFNTDNNFNIVEYFHFCSKLLKKEPKEAGQSPAMIIFCSHQQIPLIIENGRKCGFEKSYPLYFIKNYSAQVLKANMKIVGAVEHAIVLYRDKLPKFNNNKKMIFNWFEWNRDNAQNYPKIHPTQKPVNLLKQLIKIFTDEWDVVIDPCAGSGSTLRACAELNRHCYGFEVDKKFYREATDKMLKFDLMIQEEMFAEYEDRIEETSEQSELAL